MAVTIKLGEIDENDMGMAMGMGDPYIQKLLKKDSELSKMWSDVGDMLDKPVKAEKEKKEQEK